MVGAWEKLEGRMLAVIAPKRLGLGDEEMERSSLGTRDQPPKEDIQGRGGEKGREEGRGRGSTE